MKHFQFGLTLIELMVTIAIVGLLASLAVPSFRTMLVNRSVQSAADALVGDMRLARSEALKRSTRTSICRSSNGTNCAAGVGSWSDGWLVFVDMNANGTVDTGDDVIKVQQALPNIASILAPVASSTLPIFKYEPTGWAKAASLTLIVTPAGSVPSDSTRLICISINGRPALRPRGTSSC